MKTDERILFLQKYVRKNYQRLFELSPDKVVGIRIDKKKKRSDSKQAQKRRPYCFVFQVDKKVEEHRLKNVKALPPYIEVKFPDGIKRIATDVEETGRPKFHLSKCKKPLANGNIDQGTIGAYLTDDNGNWYALTNYHVVAWDRMKNDEFEFEGVDSNVTIDNKAAEFVEGILSDELDIGFVRCPFIENGDGLNQLDNDTQIQAFTQGPITPKYIGKTVSVYLGQSNTERKVKILNNSGVFDTGFKGIKLADVILLPAITKKGDSGSPVLIEDSILGIITGADKMYSYVIPFFKIYNYKSLDIP